VAAVPLETAAPVPRRRPPPDLSRWIAAGGWSILVAAAFCQVSAWAVLQMGGVSTVRLHWAGTAFAGQEAFWRLAEYEDFAAAAKLAPLGTVAWAAALGPLLLMTLPWIATRWNNPWVMACSFGAFARLFAPAVYVGRTVYAYLWGLPMPRQTSLEEYRLWVLLGVPVGFSLVTQMVVLAAGLHRAWPRAGLAEQPSRVVALAAGACFGHAVLVGLSSW
jgi:hypothetical protein